jgi:hypothetical protein
MYRLDQEIVLDYAPPENLIVTYEWNFETVAAAAIARLRATAASARAPIASTRVPRFTPASQNLSPGRYRVSVTASAPGNASLTGAANITLVGSDFSHLRVYPNPWRADTTHNQNMTFVGLTPDSKVKIFSISGRWIKNLQTNVDRAAWDLTDDSGDKVASGVYLYLITNDADQKARGKVAIIR